MTKQKQPTKTEQYPHTRGWIKGLTGLYGGGPPVRVLTEEEIKYRLLQAARSGSISTSQDRGIRISLEADVWKPSQYGNSGILYACVDYDPTTEGANLGYYALCPPTKEKIVFDREKGILHEWRKSYTGEGQHDKIREHLHWVLDHVEPSELSERAELLREIFHAIAPSLRVGLSYNLREILLHVLSPPLGYNSVAITPEVLKGMLKNSEISQHNISTLDALVKALENK